MEREKIAQQQNKIRYDARRRDELFKPGDFVYVWTPTRSKIRTTKLLHRYNGPFRLIRETTPNAWEVEDRTGRKRDIVNVVRLKPCHNRPSSNDSADKESDADDRDNFRDSAFIPSARDVLSNRGPDIVDTTKATKAASTAPDHADSDTEVYYSADENSDRGDDSTVPKQFLYS